MESCESPRISARLQELGITQNLIDALCINQHDEEERASQVAMMRLLYWKAECVRVWIHEPGFEEGSPAVTALQKFGPEPEDEHSGLGENPHLWEPVVPLSRNCFWSRIWM